MSPRMLLTQHGRRRRFYTPEEVKAHNSADDAWFSLFDKVLDLTELVAKKTALATPLIDQSREPCLTINGKNLRIKCNISHLRATVCHCFC